MSAEETELKGLVNKYLMALQLRNYSSESIRDKRKNLSRFLKWCDEQRIKILEEITPVLLNSYSRYLTTVINKRSNQNISTNTQHVYLADICRWLSWLEKTGILSESPGKNLKIPKTVVCTKQTFLTHSEVECVLNEVDISKPLGIRDRAMIETLYSTGLRSCELLRLSLMDVDIFAGTVVVRDGKGGKDRLVPLGERAGYWIEQYLHQVRSQLKPQQIENTLFLNVRGKPLSSVMLGLIIRNYIRTANIGKSGACHILRHSMATAMLENGADFNSIQKILGHSHLTTTVVYAKLSTAKLTEVYQKTHPSMRESYDATDKIKQ